MRGLETWLVQTKLHPPRRRDDLVLRQRLYDRLRAAVQENPVTIVAAPAGYGKTTLLSSLPVILPEFPLAWVSLDVDDNDPSCFFAALRGALELLGPGDLNAEPPSLLNGPLEIGPGDSTVHLRRTVGSIINWVVATQSEPFVLVLDDLHVIRERAVLDIVDYLVSHLPPHMHLVIGTRHNPLHLRARLAARRQLGEVRHADLSFTVEETDSLLKIAFGLALSPQELVTLHRTIEGWPAGLCLVATPPLTAIGSTSWMRSISGWR